MRILTVVHGYPPQQMAGAEIYARNLSEEFARQGAHVEVFCPGREEGREEYSLWTEEQNGLAVHRMQRAFNDVHSLDDTWNNRQVEERFQEILKSVQPDVVHVHHVIGLSSSIIPIARADGAKVVVTLHDFWFHCARGQRMTPRQHLCEEVQNWRCSVCVAKKRVRYLMDFGAHGLAGRAGSRLTLPFRWLRSCIDAVTTRPIQRRRNGMRDHLNAAHLILAPSQFMLKSHREAGVSEELLEFSEYGMDTSRFESSPQRVSGKSDAPRFVYTGSLIPSKGIEVLVRAFQELPTEARLDIFGVTPAGNSSTFEDRLKRINTHSGCVFHGRFDNQRIAEVLAGSDVLVVPSLWYENAPLTLAESVMATMPAITSNHGGMQELSDRFGNMLTFEAGDACDLARVMRRFIDEPGLVASFSRPSHVVREMADDARRLLERFQNFDGE